MYFLVDNVYGTYADVDTRVDWIEFADEEILILLFDLDFGVVQLFVIMIMTKYERMCAGWCGWGEWLIIIN